MDKKFALVALGAASLFPVQAGAETLRVSGIYPAAVDLPGHVEALAIAPFGGDAGADAELAISDALGSVSINGERYFRVIPDAGYGEAASDALLRGSVHSEVLEERAEPRIVTRCVERNKKGECLETKERAIPCWNLSVRMDPRIVLTAIDGTQMYSHHRSEYESAHFCRDDTNIPSVIDMGNRMIERIANHVRMDLAPRHFSQDHRIMEQRKGLGKADRAAFKQAIRLTKTSASDACAAFDELYQANPGHLSLTFNMGLCAEAFGALDVAQEYYSQARQIDANHSYHRDGAGRLAARWRADAQLAARDDARRVYLGQN